MLWYSTWFWERLMLCSFPQKVCPPLLGGSNTVFPTAVPLNINLTRHLGVKRSAALFCFNSEKATFVSAFLILFDALLCISFTRRFTWLERVQTLHFPFFLSLCTSDSLLLLESTPLISTIAGGELNSADIPAIASLPTVGCFGTEIASVFQNFLSTTQPPRFTLEYVTVKINYSRKPLLERYMCSHLLLRWIPEPVFQAGQLLLYNIPHRPQWECTHAYKYVTEYLFTLSRCTDLKLCHVPVWKYQSTQRGCPYYFLLYAAEHLCVSYRACVVLLVHSKLRNVGVTCCKEWGDT